MREVGKFRWKIAVGGEIKDSGETLIVIDGKKIEALILSDERLEYLERGFFERFLFLLKNRYPSKGLLAANFVLRWDRVRRRRNKWTK